MGTVAIRRATPDDLGIVARLAGRIWRAYYPPIIGAAQVEHMLGLMYADARLRADLAAGTRFDLLREDADDIGFAAYGPPAADGSLKLHKLYLLPERHGRGLGSLLLRHALAEAAAWGAREVTLQVNRGNARAIPCYRRHGFAVRENVVVDIGGGFVMDDHVMAKAL